MQVHAIAPVYLAFDTVHTGNVSTYSNTRLHAQMHSECLKADHGVSGCGFPMCLPGLLYII
jgi:hypothetical protein